MSFKSLLPSHSPVLPAEAGPAFQRLDAGAGCRVCTGRRLFASGAARAVPRAERRQRSAQTHKPSSAAAALTAATLSPSQNQRAKAQRPLLPTSRRESSPSIKLKRSQSCPSQISRALTRPDAAPPRAAGGTEQGSDPPGAAGLQPPPPLPRQGPLTSVFPFLTSTSLSRIAARFGSSDSTDHMGGTAG